jgi:hypothetical protein
MRHRYSDVERESRLDQETEIEHVSFEVHFDANNGQAATPEIRPVDFERSRRDDRELLFTANRSGRVRNEAVFVREVRGFDATELGPLHLRCAHAPVGNRQPSHGIAPRPAKT